MTNWKNNKSEILTNTNKALFNSSGGLHTPIPKNNEVLNTSSAYKDKNLIISKVIAPPMIKKISIYDSCKSQLQKSKGIGTMK